LKVKADSSRNACVTHLSKDGSLIFISSYSSLPLLGLGKMTMSFSVVFIDLSSRPKDEIVVDIAAREAQLQHTAGNLSGTLQCLLEPRVPRQQLPHLHRYAAVWSVTKSC
jgi:hypothetical protein